MMTPSREVLQDEFAHLSMQYQSKCNNKTPVIVSQLITACILSEKYKIDIRKYLWNVAGIKRGTYDGVIQQLQKYGITHYSEE